jgi:hypothetical protein
MHHEHTRGLRNAGVWAITAAGHVLLLWAFVYANRMEARRLTAGSPQPLSVWIAIIQGRGAVGRDRGTPNAPPALRSPSNFKVENLAAPPIELPAIEEQITPSIDWGLEASREARSAAAGDGTSKTRAFGAIPKPYFKPCGESKPAFGWDREPKKVGFMAGLPYVRVGKRCIVGLPFFGCALGKLPEANSGLLADMKGDGQSEQSVPDIPDCVRASP